MIKWLKIKHKTHFTGCSNENLYFQPRKWVLIQFDGNSIYVTFRFCLHQQRSCIGKIVIVSCIRVNWKFSQIWWKVYLLQLCGMLGASHIIWTSLLSFTDTHWFNSRMLRKEIHPQGFQQCKLPGNYCQEIETLQLMTSFSTFFF